ncbi:MAG: zinc ribbon domain-containing protein [Fimbriimonadaceae bacterium]|nr:zinc ribbon domain-containing protein [Fimbriimonadaceae bacterium]
MPLYEYEKRDGECEMCPGRFAVLQAIDDEPLAYCPTCGLPAKKVISRASISTTPTKVDYEKAARHGLTTFRKSGEGTWEKIAGEGVDAIIGTDEDKQAVREEKEPGIVIDLDE